MSEIEAPKAGDEAISEPAIDLTSEPVAASPAPDAVNRSGGPTVGLKEAARMCNRAPNTIRARKRELEARGAVTGANGWQIPIAALVDLELLDRVTGSNASPSLPTEPTPAPIDPGIANGVEPGRITLSPEEYRHMADAAAKSETYAALVNNLETTIDDLRSERDHLLGRNQLTAGTSDVAVAERTRVGFWRRVFGTNS